jgi:NitT/TauT family transport system ATP-binding protein
VPVLQGVDLSIERGEFVSIIGPSGCGKSTLLKLVAGLSLPSDGEIAVNGILPRNARQLVSFVFQDATLLPWRTVERTWRWRWNLRAHTRGDCEHDCSEAA